MVRVGKGPADLFAPDRAKALRTTSAGLSDAIWNVARPGYVFMGHHALKGPSHV